MAEYVSLKEASRRFGYEVSTIRRWLKEERVEGLKGPVSYTHLTLPTSDLV